MQESEPWNLGSHQAFSSLFGTLWFLVSGLHLSTRFWILPAEQLPLKGSWFLLLGIFGVPAALACRGTCSETMTFLLQGPLSSNFLVRVFKFRRKNWIHPAEVECSPRSHQLGQGWGECHSVQTDSLPYDRKGRVTANGGS